MNNTNKSRFAGFASSD